MLPGVFVGLGFVGLIGDTSNALSRFMSHFPLTSPSAMPVRILQGDAGTGEVLVSLVILAAAVWLARLLAGRIFALGILITGNEPSWRQMLHWLRRI
jgi:ABC-2 type transport system permease protein